MFDEVNYTINRNLRDIDFTPTYTATAGVIFINTTADFSHAATDFIKI